MKSLYCVSVVIPVYNVEPYVEKCITSVLRQTLRGFELILVDDCGTDRSMSVIGALLAREFPNGVPGRIRILHNPHNMGAGPSRNNGMDAASGEYIAFIDSDDYIAEDYLEALYREAKKQDADVVLCGYREVEPDGKLIRVVSLDCANVETEQFRKLSPTAHLYRRGFLERCHARFLNLFFEGIVFNLSVAGYMERAAIIPDTGYLYVQRPGSRTHQVGVFRIERHLPFRETANVLSEAKKNGIRSEVYFRLEYVMVKAYAAWLLDYMRHCKKECTDYYAEVVSDCLDAVAPQCHKNPCLRIRALPALPLKARVGTYLFIKAYQHHCLRQFAWFVTRF